MPAQQIRQSNPYATARDKHFILQASNGSKILVDRQVIDLKPQMHVPSIKCQHLSTFDSEVPHRNRLAAEARINRRLGCGRLKPSPVRAVKSYRPARERHWGKVDILNGLSPFRDTRSDVHLQPRRWLGDCHNWMMTRDVYVFDPVRSQVLLYWPEC